jgi:hypothetical protein
VSASNAADLLNLVGFATGTALYAMLLVLVLRRRPPADVARLDRLPLATACLGLLWNLGELAAYGLPRLGLLSDSVPLSALSFPALGLLAAVVVHSVARDLGGGRYVVGLAYAMAGIAAVLHGATMVTGETGSSTLAFQLLTACFTLLIVPLGLLTRAQAHGRRALWVLALVLFAVSATHLGSFHTQQDSWWMQLLGHHAAIPLAFAILYQNYRFALGDLFLKRALTLLTVVNLALVSYWAVTRLPEGPAAQGVMLGLWVATALLTPWLRQQVTVFVDRVLLGRVDYAVLRATLTRAVAEQASVAGVMDTVTAALTRALDARRVTWTDDPAADHGGETRVVVPTTDPPLIVVSPGELTGGRQLLSDDAALIDAVVGIAARRIDAIRLTLERYEVQLREEEMHKLAAEAELRALRAQINPHFLFNALTTIGYLIEAAPPRALRTLLRLTGLLRGVLRPDGEFTTLGRELELVEHYLDIEHERFEERLRVSIDVPAELRAVPLPALVLQPLVENAIKHGVAPSVQGGDVTITARRVNDPSPLLRLSVRNTGRPLGPEIPRGEGHLGLANVERRLAGLYGGGARLSLTSDETQATIADICLPLTLPLAPPQADHERTAAYRTGR